MKDMDDRTLEERIDDYEPRAWAYAYGHPGAVERLCKEVKDLKTRVEELEKCLEQQRKINASFSTCNTFQENKKLQAKVEELEKECQDCGLRNALLGET
jgi:DNA repair exonuclease SbcCD ATPase subunit